MTQENPAKKPEEKTYWIEFIGDRSLKINEQQSILDASLKAGIPHYHVCGGNGECSTCRVMVRSGQQFLSLPSQKELLLKETIPLPANTRLACQTYVRGGPVHLHRIIRDDADMHLYLEENRKDALELVGQEQELALFFLDIRDFTPFIESYLPFDVIHIVRRLFALFHKGIESHGGRIVDTAGDGFYAVFGLNDILPDAINLAFGAATTILNDLEEFNQLYAEPFFFHRFEAGIGLHAGRVIVGSIGVGANSDLVAMGLPVNIASRIQGATRTLDNSLLISDFFYRQLSSPPPSRKMQFRLKGLSEDTVLHLCGKPFEKK